MYHVLERLYYGNLEEWSQVMEHVLMYITSKTRHVGMHITSKTRYNMLSQPDNPKGVPRHSRWEVGQGLYGRYHVLHDSIGERCYKNTGWLSCSFDTLSSLLTIERLKKMFFFSIYYLFEPLNLSNLIPTLSNFMSTLSKFIQTLSNLMNSSSISDD